MKLDLPGINSTSDETAYRSGVFTINSKIIRVESVGMDRTRSLRILPVENLSTFGYSIQKGPSWFMILVFCIVFLPLGLMLLLHKLTLYPRTVLYIQANSGNTQNFESTDSESMKEVVETVAILLQNPREGSSYQININKSTVNGNFAAGPVDGDMRYNSDEIDLNQPPPPHQPPPPFPTPPPPDTSDPLRSQT